jgi:hypothetical protein
LGIPKTNLLEECRCPGFKGESVVKPDAIPERIALMNESTFPKGNQGYRS